MSDTKEILEKWYDFAADNVETREDLMSIAAEIIFRFHAAEIHNEETCAKMLGLLFCDESAAEMEKTRKKLRETKGIFDAPITEKMH